VVWPGGTLAHEGFGCPHAQTGRAVKDLGKRGARGKFPTPPLPTPFVFFFGRRGFPIFFRRVLFVLRHDIGELLLGVNSLFGKP
jgi:hypothetical protein